MKEHKTYCDHCGKELDLANSYEDTTIELAYKWLTADLCNDCIEKLYKIICEFCNTERKNYNEKRNDKHKTEAV